MSLQKQQEFKNELKSAKSLKEMFDIMNKYYDTSENIGFIAKGQIINNLPAMITAAQLKLRK